MTRANEVLVLRVELNPAWECGTGWRLLSMVNHSNTTTSGQTGRRRPTPEDLEVARGLVTHLVDAALRERSS